MVTKLEVVKQDGGTEAYLHTKVIGAISHGLSDAGQADVCTAQELSDVVIYYLYRRAGSRLISSGEIFSVIKTVLATTGFQEAAIALSEHRLRRSLRRRQIEVLCGGYESNQAERCGWDKSKIATDLMAEGLDRNVSRAIAGMVEERILRMGLGVVSTELIKQLVLSDTASMQRAERQLAAV